MVPVGSDDARDRVVAVRWVGKGRSGDVCEQELAGCEYGAN